MRSSRLRNAAATTSRVAFAVSAFAMLSACEKNTFVPPPPPKVEVATPVQKSITRYLDATGNTAPIKSVDLVARVQGFLQTINYKDGSPVKEGTSLFTIEPETYKLKLEQAQAAEAGAEASLKQAQSDYKRQVDLVQKQAVSQSTLDTSMDGRVLPVTWIPARSLASAGPFAKETSTPEPSDTCTLSRTSIT